MNILVAGGCDVPPPYGGLAGRILNNAAIWEQEHQVHLLLMWAKADPDLLGAKRTRLHSVYSPRPTSGVAKLRTLALSRVPRALAALLRKPSLCAAVLKDVKLLLIGQAGYHAPTAVLDALVYAAALDDLVVNEQIDVIQAHYARQETLVCEIVAARRGVPVVVVTYAEAVCWPADGEVISEKALYGDIPQWDPLFRRTFQAATHVCAPSAHCGHGPRRFVPPGKITVAYSCIDTAAVSAHRARRADYARELGIEGRKVILFVGQLAPRKGPQFLAQAAPSILAGEPRSRIVFIGSNIGGYRQKLEQLVGSCAERVTFAGGIPGEMLWKYYAVADVLVFPACTDRECMGMSMKEAMAAGAPVVAFRAGGTAEAVQDGVTGYLVDVGDVPGLARRVLDVLRGELGPLASERCQARARQLFDIQAGASLELQVLADAIAVSGGDRVGAVERE